MNPPGATGNDEVPIPGASAGGGENRGAAGELGEIEAWLGQITDRLAVQAELMVPVELARTVAALEDVAHRVGIMQALTASAVDRQNIARSGETETRFTWDVPEGGGRSQFRDTAEYLQDRIHISRGEAARRVRLGNAIAPRTGMTGDRLPPQLPVLAEAAAAGDISSRAAIIIKDALDSVRRIAPAAVLEIMETTLAEQARLVNEDQLARHAQQFINRIDQDGSEPSEEELRASQGVFLKGKRRGLYRMEIAATSEQNEALVTYMKAFTNPRSGTSAGRNTDGSNTGASNTGASGAGMVLDRRTGPQKMLDGLVMAAAGVLRAGTLPEAGGARPQILAIIDYKELLQDLRHPTDAETGADRTGAGTGRMFSSAMFAFGGPVNAATIRKMACDAGIIPVVLGGAGEVLDIGRARYEFPPAIRRALMARDKGCSFPGCSMPAAWTEAHHVKWWSRGGTTGAGSGCLLCSHHHHLIHEGHWEIEMIHGIPWFKPPGYIDPARQLRRNRYWDIPAPPQDPPKNQAAA